MISVLHLDTHVVVWLASGQHKKVPPPLRARLSTDILRISPMVRLELSYLYEVGRIAKQPDAALAELSASIGLNMDDQPFDRVADIAARTTFTRDPFDRVIAAQAIAAGAPLATKNEHIRAALPDLAVWD